MYKIYFDILRKLYILKYENDCILKVSRKNIVDNPNLL